MAKTVYSTPGLEVLKRDGRLYVVYDSGGIVAHMTECEISAAQFERLKMSKEEAYRVLLECRAKLHP